MSTDANPGRLAGWFALAGALAVVAYGGRLAEGKPPEDFLYRYEAAIGGLIQYGIILALVLLIGRGLPKRDFLALRRPASWRRAALLALVLLIVVYAVGGLVEAFSDPGKEQGLTPSEWKPERAGGFVANFFVVAVVAPFVEEATFRGAGYTLLERYGERAAVVVVGVMFALAHGLFSALPILIVLGSGLALLRARTGSVYPGIVLHSAFNALALVVAVAA